MKGIDTNLLVRYVTRDDEQQAAFVLGLVIDAATSGELLYVPAVVLCETTWVLARRYSASREEIGKVVSALIDSDVFRTEHEPCVQRALTRYRRGRAGFSDYLIGEIAQTAGCSETLTFDKKLGGESGFTVPEI